MGTMSTFSRLFLFILYLIISMKSYSILERRMRMLKNSKSMKIRSFVNFADATKCRVIGICGTFACRRCFAFFVNVIASHQAPARAISGDFGYAAADFECIFFYNLREMSYPFATPKYTYHEISRRISSIYSLFFYPLDPFKLVNFRILSMSVYSYSLNQRSGRVAAIHSLVPASLVMAKFCPAK